MAAFVHFMVGLNLAVIVLIIGAFSFTSAAAQSNVEVKSNSTITTQNQSQGHKNVSRPANSEQGSPLKTSNSTLNQSAPGTSGGHARARPVRQAPGSTGGGRPATPPRGGSTSSNSKPKPSGSSRPARQVSAAASSVRPATPHRGGSASASKTKPPGSQATPQRGSSGNTRLTRSAGSGGPSSRSNGTGQIPKSAWEPFDPEGLLVPSSDEASVEAADNDADKGTPGGRPYIRPRPVAEILRGPGAEGAQFEVAGQRQGQGQGQAGGHHNSGSAGTSEHSTPIKPGNGTRGTAGVSPGLIASSTSLNF